MSISIERLKEELEVKEHYLKWNKSNLDNTTFSFLEGKIAMLKVLIDECK